MCRPFPLVSSIGSASDGEFQQPFVHEVRTIFVSEIGRASGRERVPASRTRSSHPWSLLGCSRQPTVLEPGTRSLPETLITEIMCNSRLDLMSAFPGSSGCLPTGPRQPTVLQAGTRPLPHTLMTQIFRSIRVRTYGTIQEVPGSAGR